MAFHKYAFVPRRIRLANKLALSVSTFVFAAGMAATGASAQTTASSGGIETVTVTAQYTTQSLQSTPLSISAVTAQDIQARGISKITDLNGTLPNVVLTPGPAAFGNITQAFIRGIGQADFIFTFEPGVGMYVDDVYYGTMPGTNFELLDLDRVEVVRGPSGTLFGKNSIGGAVRLFSKKPTGDSSGHLEATYGSFDRIDVRGGADLTLISNRLFMQVSAVSRHQKGFQRVIDFACAHPSQAGSLPSRVSGAVTDCVFARNGGTDVSGGRVALRAIITPRLEVNVIGDVVIDNSDLQADSLIGEDNGDKTGIHYFTPDGVKIAPESSVPGSNAFVPVGLQNILHNIPTFGVPFDQRFIPSDPYRTTFANFQSERGLQYNDGRHVHSWGVSGAIDYDLTDGIHFKSITGYRQYRAYIFNETDQSPLSVDFAVSLPSNRQITEEARLTGTAFNDKLEWTLGGFYYNQNTGEKGSIVIDSFFDIGVKGLVFHQDDSFKAQSWSGYTQAIYHITDKLEVVGGYRYSKDKKSFFFNHLEPVANYPGSGFFRVTEDPACRFVINAACPINAPLVANTTRTTHNDYRATIDYHITDDKMVYFNFSTGYRAGGLNPRPFSSSQLTSFGAEKAKSYEVGAKTDWFGRRLRANVALFRTQYDNRIVNQQILDKNGVPFTGPINIGSARYQGAEVELIANPIDNLLLTANYSFLHMELAPQPGAKPGFLDQAGTIPAGSVSTGVPQTIWSFSGQYVLDLDTLGVGGNLGTVTPRLDYRWQDRVFVDNGNSAIATNPSYGLLNAHLTWEAPQGGWSLTFEATNLTDKKYFVNKFSLLNFGLGTLEGQPGTPREWAITLRKSF